MPTSRLSPAFRPARRASPSCRSGVSSLLRLAQPAAPHPSAPRANGGWFARATARLAPKASDEVLHVRPADFSPSQWLSRH